MIYYNKITRQQILNIFQQKKIKWLAVCIAIGIFAYFIWPAASLDETDILIPVGLDKIPSGLTITRFSPKNIEVRVRGPKFAIKNIYNLKLLYSADLSEVATGLNSVPVNLEHISFPEKLSIISVNPDFLDVVADIEIYKKVPGVIHAEIFLKEKFSTKKFSNIPVKGKNTKYSYSITPSEINVEIKGPENILEKIKEKINVYVDLKGLKPGIYVRRAVITLPVKTTLSGVEPEIFTVKIVQ